MTTAAPARKLAFHLERGDVIRHERRVYRVVSVVPVLVIPRNARATGEPSRTAYRVVLVHALGRPGGAGQSRRVTFEQDDIVPLVTK